MKITRCDHPTRLGDRAKQKARHTALITSRTYVIWFERILPCRIAPCKQFRLAFDIRWVALEPVTGIPSPHDRPRQHRRMERLLSVYSVEKLGAKSPGVDHSSGVWRLIHHASERGCARDPLQVALIGSIVVICIHRFAVRRKFCAVAANKNSSRAPRRPRRRSRSSFRIRLR